MKKNKNKVKPIYEMNFTIDEVVHHWDKVAPIYDKSNEHFLNPHLWRFIEGIKHINFSNSSDIRLLNIWSRTGNAIPYLRKKVPNAKIYNFEASPKMIKIAENIHSHESFYQTDLKSIDLADSYMDIIISQETLEHTPRPEILIEEFYRVLKPGGRLILSLPPRIADFHQWVYTTFVGGHGEGPRKGIPSWVVKKILKDEGFKIIKHKSILLIPIGPTFLIKFGNYLTELLPLLRELGVMQFYICEK